MSETRLQATRDQIAALDAQNLMLDERFKRFLFTVLNTAGMFKGYFHSEDGVLAYGEGRRSLGLDILATLAGNGSTEEVLSAVLQAEIKTQLEVQNGKRNRNQFSRDRDAELDGNADD